MVSSMCEDQSTSKEQEIKEVAKKMVNAFTNRETQKHFIRAGMEIMMGFEALVRNMPMTNEMKAIMDKSTEYASFISKEICAVNPNCNYREKRSDEVLEKIDLS